MALILSSILIGLLVSLAILSLAYALWKGPNKLAKFFREPESEKAKRGWRDQIRKMERLFKPLGGIIPRSPEEMSRQERKLCQAGIRREDGPILFYGSKMGTALVLLTAFFLTGHLGSNPLLFLLLPILGGALLPDLWLARRIRGRKDRLQLALPDALDLTVVCVEAGLSLDQALKRISEEISNSHPDLSDELSVLNREVRLGQSRSRALRNLAERAQVPDLKSLVTVLIQSDRFGTSIAQSLRIFSETFRTMRRQRAEERAAKMAVKMIPALVFFILPALMVVVIGSAVIAAIRDLLPSLTGG